MLIARCAWHARYRGWPKLLGVRRWLPLLPVHFTDGICRECSRRAVEILKEIAFGPAWRPTPTSDPVLPVLTTALIGILALALVYGLAILISP